VTNDKESVQSGKIIRAQTTDQGVPNATVTIAGKSVATNASGDYEIVVPRSTPYSMTVTAEGYYKLLEQVKDKSVQVEEYAREMIMQEEQHLGEVDKMLRKPGDIGKAGG